MDVLPAVTTFRDSKPTLLVSWWCTCYAIAIIVIRFCGRYVRAEKVFLEDGIMLLAVTPLLIRMAFVHFVLLDGTNNTVTDGLSEESIKRRELGSQLVLLARVFYAAYLWAIKYSTTLFLRSLTESVNARSQKRLLRSLHIFLLLTFLATIIADLGACHPFSHYWQATPDPGPACRTGAAHLYTMGVLNIITNLTLIIFPIPMIMKAKVSRTQKLSILARLALPLLSIALTTYTLPHITTHHFSQQQRSLFASLDILLTTFISNAVVLFSLLANKGYKAQKYKFSAYEERIRGLGAGMGGDFGGERKGRRRSIWGSDEDLMGEGERNDGVVFKLKDLSVGEEKEDEIGKGLRVKRPDDVKLGDIRVNQTWEIRVDDK